jgi:hypothetical protein
MGNLAKKLLEKLPENLPEKLPEKLPENLPENLPEQLPENLPEQLPENLPSRIRLVSIKMAKIMMWAEQPVRARNASGVQHAIGKQRTGGELRL